MQIRQNVLQMRNKKSRDSRNRPSRRSTRGVTHLRQEPGAPFGLVDEHLQQVDCRDIIVFVDHLVCLTHALRQFTIVLAQLSQHVPRRDIGRASLFEIRSLREISPMEWRVGRPSFRTGSASRPAIAKPVFFPKHVDGLAFLSAN